MTESKLEEHQRLQQRTDELTGEHDALGLDRKRFSKAEHEDPSADLLKHKADLDRHRKRRSDTTT
jgi:hypothetical protein